MNIFWKEVLAIVGGFVLTFLFIEPMVADGMLGNSGLLAFCTLLSFFYCSGLVFMIIVKVTDACTASQEEKKAAEQIKFIEENTVIVQNPDSIAVGFTCNQVNDFVL